MSNVFISYARVDYEPTNVLADEIELMGFDVWLDVEIIGGDYWWRTTLAEIRKSDVFVLCLSSAFVASKICRLELSYAESLEKPVLPVLIGHEEINHPAISNRQILKFPKNDIEHRRQLKRSLSGFPRKHVIQVPVPEDPALPTLPLIEISSRLQSKIITLEEQEDILRSLTELFSSESNTEEVRHLAKDFRNHTSVALSIANRLDEIIRVSPLAISKSRHDLKTLWTHTVSTPCARLFSQTDQEILIINRKGGVERIDTESAKAQKFTEVALNVIDADLSALGNVIAIGGHREITLRSVLGTRDPLGNTYEHKIGVGLILDGTNDANSYEIDISEQEILAELYPEIAEKDAASLGLSNAGPTGNLKERVPPFRSVLISSDKDMAFFGMDSGRILFWSLKWHRIVNDVRLTEADSIRSICTLGARVVVGDYQGRMFLLDAGGQVIAATKGRASPVRLIFGNPMDGHFSTVFADGHIARHDCVNLQPTSETGLGFRVESAVKSSYANLLAVGSRDGKISLVCLESERILHSSHALTGRVAAICWAPNGDWIAASDDERIVLLGPHGSDVHGA